MASFFSLMASFSSALMRVFVLYPVSILLCCSIFFCAWYRIFLFTDSPSSLIVSAIRFFLILRSRGVSVVNEGVWLTSSSQGFESLSRKMSKPRI